VASAVALAYTPFLGEPDAWGRTVTTTTVTGAGRS